MYAPQTPAWRAPAGGIPPYYPGVEFHHDASDAASEHVANIIAAAEQAAAQLREQAEERVAERIAEADRAAEHRVLAAEEEAAEILREARAQAEQARADVFDGTRAEAGRILEDAHTEAQRLGATTSEELAARQAEAQKRAQEIRAVARAQAREIVSEAHVVAREVVRDGAEISRNLRELSSSLRNNAERLLRDVRLAHGSMTARLDQVGPEGSARTEDRVRGVRFQGGGLGNRGARDEPGDEDDLDVPEFIPPG